MYLKKKSNLIIVLTVMVAVSLAFLVMKKLPAGLINNGNESSSQENSSAMSKIDDYGNFYISINKIDVKAPVIRGVDPVDKEKYNLALNNGVAHMVGTALPGGEKGNVFIYGHSSADQEGRYNQVFAKIDELQFGDVIKLNFNNKEYEYWITEKKLIEKNDFSVLDQSGEERLTLMTCWPIGTSDRRIVVVAKRR